MKNNLSLLSNSKVLQGRKGVQHILTQENNTLKTILNSFTEGVIVTYKDFKSLFNYEAVNSILFYFRM